MNVYIVNPVGCHRQASILRDFGHLYPRRNATERCRVRFRKIDMPVSHEVLKFVNAVQVLAGGNGNPGFLSEPRVPREVLRDNGLFQPKEAKFLQRICCSNRLISAPSHVRVCHQWKVGAKKFSHGAHPLDILR